MALKVSDEIKKIVFADPDLPAADVLAKLDAAGVETKLSTVESYRTDFLGSLRVLRELGAFTNGAAPKEPAKKAKRVRPQSRPARWADACQRAADALSDLRGIQEEYEEMKDNLSDGLTETPFGQKLEEVCGLNIESAVDLVGECEGVDLPMGFGRD